MCHATPALDHGGLEYVVRTTPDRQGGSALLPRTAAEGLTMRVFSLVLLILAVLMSLIGCTAFMYTPQNAAESVALIEATEGNGCTYLRGNSRPYADVSFMTIHAYGKTAPKYLECLQAVPPEARMQFFNVP